MRSPQQRDPRAHCTGSASWMTDLRRSALASYASSTRTRVFSIRSSRKDTDCTGAWRRVPPTTFVPLFTQESYAVPRIVRQNLKRISR
jgi:hypothetical protein